MRTKKHEIKYFVVDILSNYIDFVLQMFNILNMYFSIIRKNTPTKYILTKMNIQIHLQVKW